MAWIVMDRYGRLGVDWQGRKRQGVDGQARDGLVR